MSALYRHDTGFDSRRQRGLAMVEFAIILPLLLFLLFATAEVGRALYEYNALTKSVRDGARYLVDKSQGTTGVLIIPAADMAVARNLVVFGNPSGTGDPLLEGLQAGDVSISVVDSDYVRVAARYNFIPVFSPLPAFGLGDGQSLTIGPFSTSTVMRGLQ